MDHGPSIEITSLNWVEVGTVSRGVDSGRIQPLKED
jgi:hypothetical protein